MTEPDLTLAYGPLAEQVADVRLPPGDTSAGLVVVVHGGFWRAEWDRSHASDQSSALAQAGYVVATVEYRRVGMPGGGWPCTFDDLALLTDTVPGLVSHAVPGRVDPAARPVLVGHSAGGHLALWAASRHRLPVTSPWHRATPLPVAVVSLAGVLDLALAHRLGLGDLAVTDLLAGSPERYPERYAEADPARLLPTGVRTVLVHGIDDEPVPLAVSLAYASAATAAGDTVTMHVLPATDHMALVDPHSAAWPRVLAAVAEAAGR